MLLNKSLHSFKIDTFLFERPFVLTVRIHNTCLFNNSRPNYGFNKGMKNYTVVSNEDLGLLRKLYIRT